MILRLFLIAVAAVFFLTSCGGGGGAPVPNPGGDPPAVDPPVVNPPVVNPPAGTTGAIEGVLDVNGIPVSDESGAPADVTRATLKVIDPSEEIGFIAATNPGATGQFAVGNLQPSKVNYLNVNFATPVDLKGTGAVATPIAVNIPVQIAASAKTSLDVSVKLWGIAGTASLRKPSSDDSGKVEIEYHYSGPDGERTVRYVIDFRMNTTTFDANLDGSFDDDSGHADDDNDGIEDEREEEDEHHDDFVEVEEKGVIQSKTENSITVNGVTFTLDTRTSYEDGASRTGLQPGDLVEVKGYTTPLGNTYAEKVKLESGDDEVSGVGGEDGSDDDRSDDGSDDDGSDDGSGDDGSDDGSGDDGTGDDGSGDDSGDDGSDDGQIDDPGDDGSGDGDSGDEPEDPEDPEDPGDDGGDGGSEL
ncbi:MAG: hypothetical protein HRF49_03135 [bacterium]|jgi:hypothetical protein